MPRIFRVTITLTWLAVVLVLGYYILINTTFANHSILAANVLGESTEQQLSELDIKLTISNLSRDFKLGDVLVGDWQKKLSSFGKGADLIKVLTEGVQALTEKERYLELIIDSNKLTESLPVKSASSGNLVHLNQDMLEGCADASYDVQLNTNAYRKLIETAISENQPIVTTWAAISENPDLEKLIVSCEKHNQHLDKASVQVSQIINRASLPNIFGYLTTTNTWVIKDFAGLKNILNNYKQANDIPVKQGDFEIKNKQIYLYQNWQEGKSLDVDTTLNKFATWINNLDQSPLAYQNIVPNGAKLNYPIVDFTNLIGYGATRIDLVRDGKFNYRADFVIYGLKDIQNAVVQPGKEFSYIETVDPSRGPRTISGSPVGNGFCMATTTLFRATLESGMQITDRSNHGFNFSSYIWSENNRYPINMVDATFYTKPTVDFKFINNTKYPIMIKTAGNRNADGFQYNYVYIYGSSKVPRREVELKNWQKWNTRGQGAYGERFRGSFERVVKENGQVILTDKYTSRYR